MRSCQKTQTEVSTHTGKGFWAHTMVCKYTNVLSQFHCITDVFNSSI